MFSSACLYESVLKKKPTKTQKSQMTTKTPGGKKSVSFIDAEIAEVMHKTRARSPWRMDPYRGIKWTRLHHVYFDARLPARWCVEVREASV